METEKEILIDSISSNLAQTDEELLKLTLVSAALKLRALHPRVQNMAITKVVKAGDVDLKVSVGIAVEVLDNTQSQTVSRSDEQ